MAIDASQWETDLGYQIDDLPITLQIQGQSVSVASTSLRLSKILEEGGFISDFTAKLTGKISSFTTTPAKGITCAIGARIFRVASVSTHGDNKGIEIEIMTPDK